MTVKELHDILKEFKKDFLVFKTNEFLHLEQKVDKNTWMLGIGVGILTALQIVLHFIK